MPDFGRRDYNKLFKYSGDSIGENEPVFLVRARAAGFLKALRGYMDYLETGDDEEAQRVLKSVVKLRSAALHWRKEHDTRPADLPPPDLLVMVTDVDEDSEWVVLPQKIEGLTIPAARAAYAYDPFFQLWCGDRFEEPGCEASRIFRLMAEGDVTGGQVLGFVLRLHEQFTGKYDEWPSPEEVKDYVRPVFDPNRDYWMDGLPGTPEAKDGEDSEEGAEGGR